MSVARAKARSEARSQALYEEACRHIPGGVNSPVRAMRSVGRTYPLFIARAQGAWVEDADGNRYVDLVGSWGPMILGHADPGVLDDPAGRPPRAAPASARRPCSRSSSPRPSRTRCRRSSSCASSARAPRPRCRPCGSRAPRPGRNKILKFAGCYHGHADALLVEAGSGLATLGIPASPGVPPATTADTLTAPFNDLASVREVIERWGDELACIIVEPVAGNMGCVPPAPGFLEGLRDACDDCGALLVFDEVMTGFRVARGGAQERYAITPDLTCSARSSAAACPRRRSAAAAT